MQHQYQQQRQQQQQHHQQQQAQQLHHLPDQHQSGYASTSYNGNPLPTGTDAVSGITPLQQLHTGAMYNSQPTMASSSVDYMGGMIMDTSMMAQGSYNTSGMPSYGVNAFGADFHQQSPFVASTSVPGGQPAYMGGGQPPGQTSVMAQQHLAQPIIGMPPYVPPTGPETFSFTDVTGAAPATTSTMQSSWMATSSTAYPTPQNSTGYDATPGAQTQTSILTEPLTSEPMFDPSISTTAISTSSDPLNASIRRMASDSSTPEERTQRGSGRASGSGSLDGTPEPSNRFASKMYNQTSLHYVANLTPVDGLTERLGEFLFSPNGSAVKDEETKRKKPSRAGSGMQDSVKGPNSSPAGSINRMRAEYDGLMDASRTLLLDCFLAHSTLFFEMSVPRFRYRLSFSDKRRPSLALLNAMYLWATRISNSPQMVSMEKHFFEEACKHLDISTSTVDRLIDAVRAAMLLSAYSHSSGRHHEGWCLTGLATRLVLSCGLHRIKSNVHKPEPSTNPFLRDRFFLLPAPVDAVELGERLHAL